MSAPLIHRSRVFGILYLVAALLLAECGMARAQQPAPQAAAEDWGLVLPRGTTKPGGGRRVLVQVGDNRVVGKVHVEAADRLIVILSNGRLISDAPADVQETERPFVPATDSELLAELTKDKFQGFKTRDTRRYIYVYNSSDAFAEATSRILETMFPALLAYCKRQGIDVHEPELPLVAIMFRTQDEFDQYHKMDDGVVAYYNSVNNYIVMYEQSKLAEIAPTLAIKQSISTIAHEGVHQILHNIGVQQRLSRWPMWISEGLPEYFAPTTTDERVRWKGVGLVNDLRMYTLSELLKANGDRLGDGRLIRNTVAAESLDADGYAVAWALTHFLAKFYQKELFAYLREVSAIGPLEDRTADSLALFTKHFGDDFAKLQADLIKHLQKQPYVDPIANQPHYVAVMETNAHRAVFMTTSPAAVYRWQQEALGQLPPNERVTARFNVQAFPNQALGQRAMQAALQ